MRLETHALPFFYVVFENGVTIKEHSWDKAIEIPGIKFIIKVYSRKNESTNYSNQHYFFDCDILNIQNEKIAVRFGTNTVFNIWMFYNSSTWPQVHSCVKYSIITSDYKVLQFNQKQDVGAADPMDNNKKFIEFISSFKSIEADGNNPAISKISPSGLISLK